MKELGIMHKVGIGLFCVISFWLVKTGNWIAYLHLFFELMMFGGLYLEIKRKS